MKAGRPGRRGEERRFLALCRAVVPQDGGSGGERGALGHQFRFGSPDDLIGATLLLASNKAGGFITGTEMVVDGGFNAMKI